MKARNALLGVLLGAVSVPSLAASPIPVVESGTVSTAAVSAPVPASVRRPAAAVTPSISQPGILLNQLESLQNEVMEMRGLLEEQANLLDRIQKENRDRYLDLDRRISQLSAGNSVSPVMTPAPVSGSLPGLASQAPEADIPTSGSVAASVAEDNGEKLYQETFRMIRDRKFKEAVVGLNEYLQKFPRGSYADNAQYWLGEVHLAQGDLRAAETAFSALVKVYPMSDKLPDATYKLGQVYDRLGESAKAREYLQMVVKNFPGSSAARLADVYLRNLEG